MNLDDPWDDSPPDTREVEVVRQKLKAEDEVEKYLVDEVRASIWPRQPTVRASPPRAHLGAFFCHCPPSNVSIARRALGARQRPNAPWPPSLRVGERVRA